MEKGQALELVHTLSGFSELLHNPRGKPVLITQGLASVLRLNPYFSEDNNSRIKHMSIKLGQGNYVSFPSCVERSALAIEIKGHEM